MKTNLFPPRRPSGFTLVELLTVIAIIGILAAMIVPVLAAVKKHALKVQAKNEAVAIVQAIVSYDQDYGRFPITADEKAAAYFNGNYDFTTGYIPKPNPGLNNTWPPGNTSTSFSKGTGYAGYSFDNNSNVVAILMDLQNFPNGTPTLNTNHVYNPKQGKYLNAKISDYDPINKAVPNPSGGVDQTGVYRDPWGNPYIITMDTSYDDQCADLVYSMQQVSQQNNQAGYNGLVNTINNGNSDNFQFHGKVMVWSAGPDGKVSTPPGGPLPYAANVGYNKDNILSWQ